MDTSDRAGSHAAQQILDPGNRYFWRDTSRYRPVIGTQTEPMNHQLPLYIRDRTPVLE
ncbi:MAG: hypothetical protein MZV65_20280 [Chromatiales bacterium]|nr:hypothetical protein [Chromatiales bacterium]